MTDQDVRDFLERMAAEEPIPFLDTGPVTRRARRRAARTVAVGAVAAAAAIAVLSAGVAAIRTAPTPAGQPTTSETPAPTPSVWSPLREGGASVVQPTAGWRDTRDDAPVEWVDVKRVESSAGGQPGWLIRLAAKPPPPADREPGLLIAYGIVLDMTDDGVADYLIGIDNDAPEPGDFHVWVTDLATGETDEQIGPPYGLPVEFSHPDEEGPRWRVVSLFFLPGSALPGLGPADLDPFTVRWYAWASAARDGEVFATDYAPDTDWIEGL